MNFRSIVLAAATAAAALGVASVEAQVLYGNEGDDDAIYLLDLNTGSSSVFFSTTGIGTTGVYGLATNFEDQLIYWSDNNEIHTITFAGVHVSSVLVAGDLTQLFGGLAYDDANDVLYGTNNTNNLYTIDLTTGLATDLGDVTGAGTLTGLGWSNGVLYGSDDGANDAFLTIDPSTVTANIIAGSDFPGGDSDMDGMAAGGGRLFGINDAVGSPIYDFDLGAGSYNAGFTAAYADSGIFSGGTFIPGPASLALIGIAGLARRRRRRA